MITHFMVLGLPRDGWGGRIRKPMCTYDYLPFESCHSSNTKLGISKGEIIRPMHTNLFRESFEAEVEITFRKILDRGYDRNA